MPVFNPTEPHNGIPVDADFLRDQFNSLKDLIDGQAATIADLQTRVATLENPPLTAAGFGEPGANGVLTETGITNGYPEYTISGGYVLRYGQIGMNMPRYFILANAPDDLSMARYDNGVAGEVLTGNVWQQGAGMGPAGTIS